MSRPFAVFSSFLGTGMVAFGLLVAQWISYVRYLTSGEQMTFGIVAALGIVLIVVAVRAGGPAMVAIDIAIFILFGLGYMLMSSAGSRSPQKRALADISTIATAVGAYATDYNKFPRTQKIGDLARTLSPTYIKSMPLTDPWGVPYRYESSEGHFAIGSAGWDRKFEKSSLQQYTLRTTASHDCDLIMQDGYFVSYPEGAQVDKPPNFDEATKLYKDNRYAEAIPIFEKFIEKNPEHALANARLGISLCQVERFKDAMPYLNTAIRLDPNDYQSRSNLGLAYEKLGKPEEGIEWERKAAALQPDNPEVLNNLGWVLLQAKHNREALKIFERTVRLAPGVKQYRENLQRARSATGG